MACMTGGFLCFLRVTYDTVSSIPYQKNKSLQLLLLYQQTENMRNCVCRTSVASFLVLGGGGERPPNVPTEKSNLYARASEASERLRNIYFQVSKYICTYTMQFPVITYGIALYRQYNDNILTLSMRASGASELRFFFGIFTF